MENTIDNCEEWKKELRNMLIRSCSVGAKEQTGLYSEIAKYYMCYAPAYLYKYYSDKTERLNHVKANKMWYSAPCKFNDVFDSDVYVDTKMILKDAVQILSQDKEIRVGSARWHQLNQTINKETRSLMSLFDNMKTTTGISCFSEFDDSLLMWAHYAKNHCGMCVEYELLEINKQLGFTPVPVIYSDVKASLNTVNFDKPDIDAFGLLVDSLTSKSTEWGYEREWRIIRDNAACQDKWDDEKKGALLDMIRPTSIILGCAAEEDFEKSVREHCEENRIPLYKMQKDKSLYKLNKVPVLEFDS